MGELDLRYARSHGTFHDVAGTWFNDAVLPGATETLVEPGLTPQAVRTLPQTVFQRKRSTSQPDPGSGRVGGSIPHYRLSTPELQHASFAP